MGDVYVDFFIDVCVNISQTICMDNNIDFDN